MGIKKLDSQNRIRALAFPLIPLMTLLSPTAAHGAHLAPGTSEAWDDYVKSANTRMEQRLGHPENFLWVDEAEDRLAKVRAGEIVVSPVGPQSPKKVPSGLIHDWVGAVFIPNATLADALQVVRDYGRYKDLYQPSVIDSKVIATGEEKDRFSMLLLNRSLLLKTAFDADYESSYVHVDDRRVYSVSRTTRLQEIEDYGSSEQHVLQEGEGKGVMWRLLGITRYMERDGGVYIEFEAIGLSRDIPASIRWLVEPTVRRVSRNSISTSLHQTEDAVRLHAELASRKYGEGGSKAAGAGSAGAGSSGQYYLHSHASSSESLVGSQANQGSH